MDLDGGAEGTQRRECARCLYNLTIPGITFDSRGECNYCLLHDDLEREYPTGQEGLRRLEHIAERIRAAGKGKEYDVVVGVSGGCDSTFMLHKAIELGLRPLAVHFDNTWDSPIAVENIKKALDSLNVDLYTYVVDNEEYDDIYRSFLQAGVRDVESPTDIALAVTLNLACEKYGIKYIFEGHSFRTEGISPLGWLYMDGRYISSVHKQYGTIPMNTFPNMPISSFLKWAAKGIKKIRPLYFLDYDKNSTMEFLSSEFGWQWYGGHHLENRFTAFYWTYFMPRRFAIDGRLLGHSALVRSGQLTRDEAASALEEPLTFDPELLEMVKKRLGYSDAEFDQVMSRPLRTYQDFPTYKRTFERLRPLFWLLYRTNRVPKSFYLKYTVPHSLPQEDVDPTTK